VIGAGAAGMMCAIEAGKRGRSRAGGRPRHRARPARRSASPAAAAATSPTPAAPDNFLSGNPRFCISALRRYTPADFIALVDRYGIAWHEKTLGQLFCDDSAKQIIDLLLAEMAKAGAELRLETASRPRARRRRLRRDRRRPARIHCASVVVATGGKSIPKMGATGFGYEVAARSACRSSRPARPWCR
jgi:predicted flavoprotein YhiN